MPTSSVPWPLAAKVERLNCIAHVRYTGEKQFYYL